MTVIATCGHAVEDLDDLIHLSLASYARDASRAVSFVCYCSACADRARRDGEVLYDQGEENKWLGGQ